MTIQLRKGENTKEVGRQMQTTQYYRYPINGHLWFFKVLLLICFSMVNGTSLYNETLPMGTNEKTCSSGRGDKWQYKGSINFKKASGISLPYFLQSGAAIISSGRRSDDSSGSKQQMGTCKQATR